MPGEDEKVLEALERAQEPHDNKIVLSTGVVLLGKKANPLILLDVIAAFPRPQPPMWFNKTMGRQMENPDDPDYLARVQAWERESSSMTLTAFIQLGTELVSTPKGFPRPEDDTWLEEYELLGLPMRPQNAAWRYLKWVKFKAVSDEKDLEKIRDVVGRLSGVSKQAVESAESFPGRD
jgi:hypothetical protein